MTGIDVTMRKQAQRDIKTLRSFIPGLISFTLTLYSVLSLFFSVPITQGYDL